jgi:hypothetical protein
LKIKPYEETHMDGITSLGLHPEEDTIIGDFGIKIAEDGRVWICLGGVCYLRFKPNNKYYAVGNKLKGGDEQ